MKLTQNEAKRELRDKARRMRLRSWIIRTHTSALELQDGDGVTIAVFQPTEGGLWELTEDREY